MTRALFATGPERPVALKPFKYGSDNESVDAANLEVPAAALKDPRVRRASTTNFSAATAELGSTTLRIVTLAGVSAESPLEVETGVQLRTVSTGKIELAAPAAITLTGENFGSGGPGSAVLLGGLPLDVRDWTESKITATLDDELLGRNAYVANEQAKLVVQDGNGQESGAWTLQVA